MRDNREFLRACDICFNLRPISQMPFVELNATLCDAWIRIRRKRIAVMRGLVGLLQSGRIEIASSEGASIEQFFVIYNRLPNDLKPLIIRHVCDGYVDLNNGNEYLVCLEQRLVWMRCPVLSRSGTSVVVRFEVTSIALRKESCQI